jgi:DeoR family transcriptional regulator of aga operon/DeoR family fructose operon transcriptional repressor
MKEVSVAERRQFILDRVNEAGRVSVAELSQDFGLSEVTIRQDLQALADGSLLLRTHGGAIAANATRDYLSLNLRRQQQVQEKAHIGAAAAALIRDGDAIFLDSSSTALAIALCLKDRRYLTVVTNGLAIAQELLDASGVEVFVIGGRLRRDTASLVGTAGLDILRHVNLRRGFFGSHGISVEEGLTDVSSDEAELKRPVVDACREVVAVVDRTKWGRVGVASFAAAAQLSKVITDRDAPRDLVDQIRAAGADVILV